MRPASASLHSTLCAACSTRRPPPSRSPSCRSLWRSMAAGGSTGFLRLVPDASRERWRRIGSGVSRAVGGYVFGNVLISVIAGSVTTLVLLATGVPYAVPLGLVVGFLDLIPVVGALLGAVIVGAVALTKGVATTVIVVAAMMLYQQIENQHADAAGLSPDREDLRARDRRQCRGRRRDRRHPRRTPRDTDRGRAQGHRSRELLAWRRGENPPEEPTTPRRTPSLAWPWRRAKDTARRQEHMKRLIGHVWLRRPLECGRSAIPERNGREHRTGRTPRSEGGDHGIGW